MFTAFVASMTVADGLTAWCGIIHDPQLCPEFQHDSADLTLSFKVVGALTLLDTGILFFPGTWRPLQDRQRQTS
jgi:hypothetical protein